MILSLTNLTHGQYIVTIYHREEGTGPNKLELELIGNAVTPAFTGLIQKAVFGVLTNKKKMTFLGHLLFVSLLQNPIF